MEYPVSRIKEYVYDLLDENGEILEERLDYGDPHASAGALIEALLPRAAQDTLLSAPLWRIDESKSRSLVKVTPRRAGYMDEAELPSDFLRLVYIRMSDWEDGLSEVLEHGSLAWQLRSRQCPTGYRLVRPGVSVRSRGVRRQLLIYGSGADSKVAEFEYVAMPEVKDGKIDLPPGVVHDVCEHLAGMVKEILWNQKAE